MKTLYTNGCSWTAGDELTDPAKEAWPVILADKLDYSVINQSKNGGSNDHIMRTTAGFLFDWIGNGKDPDDLCVVIGWTNPGRKEVPIWEDGKMQYKSLYPSMIPETQYWKDYHKNWLMYHCFEEDFVEIYNRNMVLLSSFLELYNIPYMFFSAFGPVEFKIEAYMKDKLSEPALKAIHDKIPMIKQTFSEFCHSHNLKRGPRQHPLEDAHRMWGEYLYEEIVKYYS